MSELRIALIMGGGVSLGSFSSGALAQVLKLLAYAERGPAKIDVVTGASAGSMTLGIVLYHLFRGSTLQEIEHALYDSWVERISFDALHPNLQSHRQPSVFTDESIRSIAKTALSFDSWSSHRHPHPFFAEETVVSFALTNLNGIPVRTEGQLIQQGKAGGGTAGGSDSVFADAVQTTFHDDVIRFVLRRTPPARGNGDLNRYGARTLLPWTTEARTREWEMFREAAIASGAFPVAFPPVRLRRKRNEYRVWDKELGDAQDTEFTFDYLDGGILRNEPLREAIHLAAKRDEGQDVERVFVLIDPNVSGTNELYPLSFNQALALQQHFSDWGDPSSILLDTPTYIAHMLGVLGRFGGVLASQATFRDWLKAARVNSQIEWRKRLTALLDDVDLVAGANAESLMDELLLDIYRDKAVRSPTATLSPEDRAEIEAAIQQDLSRRAEDGRIDFRTKIFLLIDLIGNLRDKQKLNMVAITPASVPGGGTIPIAGNFFNNFGGFFNVEYRQHDFEAGAYVASEVLTAEVPGARAFLQQGAPKAPRPDPRNPDPSFRVLSHDIQKKFEDLLGSHLRTAMPLFKVPSLVQGFVADKIKGGIRAKLVAGSGGQEVHFLLHLEGANGMYLKHSGLGRDQPADGANVIRSVVGVRCTDEGGKRFRLFGPHLHEDGDAAPRIELWQRRMLGLRDRRVRTLTLANDPEAWFRGARFRSVPVLEVDLRDPPDNDQLSPNHLSG